MASRAGGPRVGVIADSHLQRHAVCKALQSFGYEIAATLSPDRVESRAFVPESMDMWLIDLEDEDRWLDFLTGLLETAEVPILFGAGKAPSPNSPLHPSWQRRIYIKVRELVGQPATAVATLRDEDLGDKPALKAVTPAERVTVPRAAAARPARPARAAPVGSVSDSVGAGRVVPAHGADQVAPFVWVLGASLGGPVAVKTFLDALPEDLPIAFIVAQHIDAGFQKVLGQVLGRHNHFHFVVDSPEGYPLRPGDVFIAPVDQVVSIDARSCIRCHPGEWEGPYSPSIDQVMDSTALALGDRTGAILFSGMGNDGSIAGQRMKQRGIPVWAQTAETCASSSQPDSARAAGCVSYNGSPEDLAMHLTEYARSHYSCSITP